MDSINFEDLTPEAQKSLISSWRRISLTDVTLVIKAPSVNLEKPLSLVVVSEWGLINSLQLALHGAYPSLKPWQKRLLKLTEAYIQAYHVLGMHKNQQPLTHTKPRKLLIAGKYDGI